MDFWFGASSDAFRPSWFRKDAAFGAAIRDSFLTSYEHAARGDLAVCSDVAHGALALVIGLDQFPRKMFRNGRACVRGCIRCARARIRSRIESGATHISVRAVSSSEALADQERSVALFESIEDGKAREGVLGYAHRHRDFIRRFGRFPHRNHVLGRASTAEEISSRRALAHAFGAMPGSSF